MIEKILVNLVVAIIEIICICVVCKNGINRKSTKVFFVGVSCVLLYFIWSIITDIFIKSSALMLIVNVIILYGVTYLYGILQFKRIMAIVLYVIIGMALEMLSFLCISLMLKINVEAISLNIELYSLAAIISKFALYIVFKAIMILIRPHKDASNLKYGIINLILPITTLATCIILSYIVFRSDEKIVKILVLAVSCLLVISNFIAYAIYEYSIKNKVAHEKQLLENYSLIKKQREYEDLIDQQLSSNKEIHEVKHKMFGVREILNKESSSALQIVDELCQIYKDRELVRYTQVDSLDALLNIKLRKAKIKGRGLVYKIAITELFLDKMDLCMLVGNILDNAIEHSASRETNNIIDFKLITHNNYLVVSCENTTDNIEVCEGLTTKINRGVIHGYGLLKIREIVEKYSGNVHCEIRDGTFNLNIRMNNCCSHPEIG